MPSDQLSPELHSSGWSKGAQLSSKHDMGEHLARMSAQLSSLEAQFVSQDLPVVKYRSTSDAVPAHHEPRTSSFSITTYSSVQSNLSHPLHSAASDEEGKKRAAARRTAILQAYAASRSSSPKNSSETPLSYRQPPPRIKEPAALSPIAASPSTLPPSVSQSPENEIRIYQLRQESSDESDSVISEEEALKVLESGQKVQPRSVVQDDDDDTEEDSDIPEEVHASSLLTTPSFSFDATLSGLPSPRVPQSREDISFGQQRISPEVPLAARIALLHQRQAQRNMTKTPQPLMKPQDPPPSARFNPGVRSLGLDDSVLYGSPVVNLNKKRRAEEDASPLTPTPTPASLPPRPPTSTAAKVAFPRAGWTNLSEDDEVEENLVKEKYVNESAFSRAVPSVFLADLEANHAVKGALDNSVSSLGHELTLSVPLAYSPQRYVESREEEDEESDYSDDEKDVSFSLDAGTTSFQHDLKKTLIVTGKDMMASGKQSGSSEGLRVSSDALHVKLRRLKELRQQQQPLILSPTSLAPAPTPAQPSSCIESSKQDLSKLRTVNIKRPMSSKDALGGGGEASGSRRTSMGNSPSYSSSRASTPSHTSFSHSSDLLMHEPLSGDKMTKASSEGSPAIAVAAAAYARALVGEGRRAAQPQPQSSGASREGIILTSNAGGLLDVRRSLTTFLNDASNPPSTLRAPSPPSPTHLAASQASYGYGHWATDSLDQVSISHDLSGTSLQWGAMANPSLPPPAYPPPKARAGPPTFYSYSPPMGEEGVRAASPNLILTTDRRRSSSEDRAILIGSMSSSPSPEPPTSSSHKPPSQKPATDIAAAAATAAVPPPATASSSRSAALLRLKQKRLESLSHAHDDSSQVKDVDQEVHGSSNYSLRSSARSIPPPATKVHTSEPPPHINEGHRWMDEEGEEAPKQFLKRRSKAVTSIKVDWSHVRPRTITTSQPGGDPRQEPRPPSAPRGRTKEPQGPPKPRFGLGPMKDRSLLKGFGDPSPVKPSQYHPSGSSRSGLTSAKKAMASRNPAEAVKKINQRQPYNHRQQPSAPSSPTGSRPKARNSSDLGYEVISRPTTTFHPSGDYSLSPRKEQQQLQSTPSKFNFQLSRGSASASIEGSPLQQLLSHVNSLLKEFDANMMATQPGIKT